MAKPAVALLSIRFAPPRRGRAPCFQISAQEHFNADQSQPIAAGPRDEAAELIGRYPNLSEIELARLVNLYREFSALDTALIISDEQLGPKLDLFFADHRSKVESPISPVCRAHWLRCTHDRGHRLGGDCCFLIWAPARRRNFRNGSQGGPRSEATALQCPAY